MNCGIHSKKELTKNIIERFIDNHNFINISDNLIISTANDISIANANIITLANNINNFFNRKIAFIKVIEQDKFAIEINLSEEYVNEIRKKLGYNPIEINDNSEKYFYIDKDNIVYDNNDLKDDKHVLLLPFFSSGNVNQNNIEKFFDYKNLLSTINSFIKFIDANINEYYVRLNELKHKLDYITSKTEKQKVYTEIVAIKNEIKQFSDVKEILLKLKEDSYKLSTQKSNIFISLGENIYLKELKITLNTFIQNRLAFIDKVINEKLDIFEGGYNYRYIKNLIDFLKSIGDISYNAKNPFIHNINELIKLINENKLSNEEKSFINFLIHIKNIAIEKENLLDSKIDEIVKFHIEKNEDLKKIFGEKFKFNELLKDLPDITIFDKYLFNISFNLSSNDTLLAQIMFKELRNKFNEKRSEIYDLLNKFDLLQKKVEKKLNKISFLGFTRYDYSIFFQKDENGFKTGRLISRFTQKWYSLISSFYKSKNKSIVDYIEAKKRLLYYADILDYRKLPEVYEKFKNEDLYKIYLSPDENYRNELIKLLGIKDYEKIINEVINKLNEYLILYKTELNKLNNGLIAEDVFINDVYALNPFFVLENYNDDEVIINGVLNKYKVLIRFEYNHFIPKKYIKDKNGNLIDSNLYDENFDKIIQDEDLYEFYDVLFKSSIYIGSAFVDAKIPIVYNSVIGFKKSFYEMIIELKGENFFVGLKKFFQILYDYILEQLTIIDVNPVEAKDKYGINKRFVDYFNVNKEKIAFILENKAKHIYKIGDKNTKLDNESIEFLKLLTGNSDINFLNKIATNEKTLKYYINKYASHKAMEEISQDIPKTYRLALILAYEYNARKELSGLFDIYFDYYKNIKRERNVRSDKNVLDNYIDKYTGRNIHLNLRERAIKRMERFINVIVKGNVDDNIHGVFRGYLKNKNYKYFSFDKDGNIIITEKNKTKILKGIAKFLATGQVQLSSDKKFKKDLLELLNNKDVISDDKTYNKIKYYLKEYDRKFALSSLIDSILNFIIFKALAYNFNSAITNRMEGKFANILADSTGLFWTYGNFYEAEKFVSNYWKNRNFANPEIKKQYEIFNALLDQYDIIEDVSNELQKASVKASKTYKYFQPYYISVGIVEKLNQGAVVLAILKDIKIKDINGKEYSIFENGKFIPFDIKDGKLILKDEFNTKENYETWILNKSKEFNNFKGKVTSTIIALHGDYDNLSGGLLIKETNLGRALMMFKTWLPMQLWLRFAKEQYNLSLGTKFKGRYYSHTKVTGTIHGALLGSFFGPVGTIIGTGVGFLWGLNQDIKTDISSLKELVYVTIQLIKKTFFLPFNLFGIGGKISKVDTTKFYGLSELDAKNIAANITEMSLLLAGLLVKILIMSLKAGEDDEKDKPIKPDKKLYKTKKDYLKALKKYKEDLKLYNAKINSKSWLETKYETSLLYLDNKIGQFISNLTAYTNPIELYKTFSYNGLISTLYDLSDFIQALEETLEGEGIYKTGIYTGYSKLYIKGRNLFFPNFISSFGFGLLTKKDFTPNDFWEDVMLKDYKERLEDYKKLVDKTPTPLWVKLEEEEKKKKTKEQ